MIDPSIKRRENDFKTRAVDFLAKPYLMNPSREIMKITDYVSTEEDCDEDQQEYYDSDAWGEECKCCSAIIVNPKPYCSDAIRCIVMRDGDGAIQTVKISNLSYLSLPPSARPFVLWPLMCSECADDILMQVADCVVQGMRKLAAAALDGRIHPSLLNIILGYVATPGEYYYSMGLGCCELGIEERYSWS